MSQGSMRTKIMFAIGGLGLGGAEMVVRDLAHGLDRDRFDVCICCTKGIGGEIGAGLLQDGFDVFVLPGHNDDRADYLSAVKFLRAVKQKQVDIVHSHATTALFDAAPSRLLMPRTRLVHTFHYGNYPYESWRHHMMEGLCARGADRLVAVGLEQRCRIQESYKLSESRVDMVWNGVTLSPAAPKASFREEIQTRDRLLVGTIAKLIEQKGLDHLLNVARYCRDSGFAVQFVIVGEGPLRPMLEQRRRELQLEDTVVLTGWIPNAAARVLPEFDVFFQSSRWEAMSIAILEAMANGKAIVATKVGDNPHVLEDDVSGLLVDTGDIAGMANALIRLGDGDTRQRLGNAARKQFEKQFTVEHMVRGYESIYRELMER